MKSLNKRDFPYRNIISKNKEITLQSIVPLKSHNKIVKPPGLWYGIRHSWAEWLFNLDLDITCKNTSKEIYNVSNLYKLIIKKESTTDINNPNKNKILIIKKVIDFVKFTKKFSIKDKNKKKFCTQIKWYDVMKHFGGIEIPILNYKLHNYRTGIYYSQNNNDLYLDISGWYYGWDVASGCIWNNKVPHEITKII